MTWLNDAAGVLDPLFGEFGSMSRHQSTLNEQVRRRADRFERAGTSSFHPEVVEHLNQAFQGLAGNPAAQATLANLVAFVETKSRVARNW